VKETMLPVQATVQLQCARTFTATLYYRNNLVAKACLGLYEFKTGSVTLSEGYGVRN
jgi:hypothetical protein